MGSSLHETLAGSGAVADAASGRPLHFGDPDAELRAALACCALADRSDLGRVLGAGPDLLDLLHRLSTQAIRDLAAGQGRATVLTSNKGRIVERLFVHHLGPAGILMLTGPGNARHAIGHLDRYTFAEQTGLSDVSATWCQLALIGPAATQAAGAAGLPTPEEPLGARSAELAGATVHVLGGDGLSADGLSVVVAAADAPRTWAVLLDAVTRSGGRAAGDRAIEAWRVLRGLPANGHELTEDHNPLEAGLWDAVHFDKGCYVGQEVVARLNTYDKVARAIRGFVLPAGAPAPTPGAPLLAGTRRVGAVTSAVVPPGREAPVALGYVKRDFAAPGTELILGEGDAARTVVVRELPFGDTP